ncbi:DoxX family membrane protein [Streptomyces laculatispora]|uniref:DoxX family membrane protein n=1 Tax=Streptomyces laculatispora TaxID=887464 RepID=A0ABY9HWY6_9ACTN|nr:DoxX family membrane protein [Streptomyces laculatispora]WLQ38904.1 DoxX family membrane protein [Streptomyces laculatispora]
MLSVLEPRDIPPRLATGAFILNSGLGKLKADEATAQALHGMARTAYPFVEKLEAERFTRLLAWSEIAVGSALLVPVVPTRLAGLALAGFSGGLLGLYLRLPGMREPGSLRPTQTGVPLAKDAWMFGIGLGFLGAGGHRCGAPGRRCRRHRRCGR